MAISISISESEKRALKKTMQRLLKDNQDGLKMAMGAAGLDMQNAAKEAAPVGTPESTGIKGYLGGTLRQSIRYVQIENGLGAKISTNVHYAVYQNNGTSRISGKRFMEKGFAAGVSRLMRTLRIR